MKILHLYKNLVHFSSYQVIVLKVADGVEVLPDDYGQRLKSASKAKLNFYIAAEIKNDPVREKSWDFTVGDEKDYEVYVNKKLEKGEVFIVYQRAITRDKNVSSNDISKLNSNLIHSKNVQKVRITRNHIQATSQICLLIILLAFRSVLPAQTAQ